MLGSFSSGHGFGISMFLEDKFTAPASRIDNSMRKLDKSSQGLMQSMNGGLGTMFASLGAGFAIASAVGMASRLSDQMVSVQNATGLTANEMGRLRGELEKMDSRMSLADRLDLAQTGHQLGVATDELSGFVQMGDKVGAALGDAFGGASTAVTKLSQLSKSFEETAKLDTNTAIMNVGNAINAMADNARVSANDVTQFAMKLGQMGAESIGVSIGIGTALAEMGVKTKQASSTIGLLSSTALSSTKYLGEFANLLGKSTEETQRLANVAPEGLFLEVANSLSKIPADQQASALARLGIRSANAVAVMKTLSKNNELLTKRVDLANKSITNADGILFAYKNSQESLAGVLDRTREKFSMLMARVGEVIVFAFKPLIDVTMLALDGIMAFITSPVGRFLTKWATTIGAVAVGLVAVHKAIGFISKAMKTLAIASRTAVTSMMPILLMAAPIILLVGYIQKARQAFAEFDGTVQSGFSGFLQKSGAILAVIQEVWSSWDSVNQQFAISGDLMNKLEQMGLKELALSIATWVVRIKEFFGGLFQGIREGFKAVGKVLNMIFKPIKKVLKFFGVEIGKNTTATEKWAKAGKIAGYVIVGALTAILAILAVVAIQSLIAFAPMLITIGLIGLAIYALYHAFMWLWDNILGPIWEWTKALVEIGYEMVMNLWEGFKKGWKMFKEWLNDAIEDIPILGGVIGMTRDASTDMLKAGAIAQAQQMGRQITQEELITYGSSMQDLSLEPTGMFNTFRDFTEEDLRDLQEAGVLEEGIDFEAVLAGINNEGQDRNITVNVPVQLDGEAIGRATANFNENEMSRE